MSCYLLGKYLTERRSIITAMSRYFVLNPLHTTKQRCGGKMAADQLNETTAKVILFDFVFVA